MVEPLPDRPHPPLRIAISDCLLGQQVRYDGSSARSSFPHTLLDGLFEFRGICPEVAIGMGTPRDAIRLVGEVHEPRAVGVADPTRDVTDALSAYGNASANTLGDVLGYVFMKNSPSCGLFTVKVYPLNGDAVSEVPLTRGQGAFARAVVSALPNLPVEENGRLNDPVLRRNFVIRVFAFGHLHACFGEPEQTTASRLRAFDSCYQYLLMAHSERHYRQARNLLDARQHDVVETAAAYASLLMDGLARPATAEGHAKVLSHVQSDVNMYLQRTTRLDVDALICAYVRGEQPLTAPLALLEEELREIPDAYAKVQAYVDPHPGYAGRHG